MTQYRVLCSLFLGVVLAAFPTNASAAEFTVGLSEKTPPEGVAQPIADLLGSQAIQLSDGGDPVMDFWFVKSLPLTKKPESNDKALEALAEMTVVGVVKVEESQRDYRDDELYEDTYTMRYGLRLQDGNHQGTSEFLYFVVLTPVSADQKVNAFEKVEDMLDASSKDTASQHPLVLSLRPVAETGSDGPTLSEPAPEHTCLRIELPASVDAESTHIAFDLVVEGIGEV